MRLASFVRTLAAASALAFVSPATSALAETDSTAPAATAALTGPQVGAPAPAFSLTTLQGKRVDLASFAGKVLVINVWATWCPPCRAETPDLIAAEARLRGKNVAFLGVDTTEDAPIVRAFASARNIVYPQAIDRDKTFAKAYDVAYFPTTYVIDPGGILRARYIDVLGRAQLAALVASARAGRDAAIVSPLQAKIDATLADGAFAFAQAYDASTTLATAKNVDAAIGRAESLLDESDAARGNATDLLRTRAEEAAVRDRALAALAANPPSASADVAFVARLRGDAARDREQYADAYDAYVRALAASPSDAAALAGMQLVASRLEKYDAVVDADERLAALDPTDVGALVDLARAQAKLGTPEAAAATFRKAEDVAHAQILAHPGDAKALRMAAYAHLYAGRTFAKAGDAVRARDEFDRTLALAKRLPPHDGRHDMYLEEAQEAIVALALGARRDGASVSLAPWTGAELPGSIPGTRKFRLVVAGVADRTVRLRTSNVPKGWVASFCTDLVCSPFRTTVALPESGVRVVEFQLIPPHDGAPTPRVRVTSNDGAHESSATT